MTHDDSRPPATDHEPAVRDAVRERLFEAALAEVVTGDPLAEATVDPAASRPAHALPAAAALFGVAVALAVWWLRQDDLDRASQQPAPIPIPIAAEGGAALRALDRGTVAIRLEEGMPDDLAVLPEFPQLRYVSMNPRTVRGGQQAWQRAGLDTLEPLTRCANLEVLGLPFTAMMSTEHLELLARCPRLRSFEVRGASLRIEPDTVAVLATWPALTRLRLLDAPMSPAGLRALGTVAGLRELEFYRCNQLDDACFEALTSLTNLRLLRITGLGPEPTALPGLPVPSDWQPDARQLQALHRLEQLRDLTLLGMTWTKAHVDALPDALERLSLSSNQVIPSDAIRSMRRFDGLQQLAFGRVGGDDAQRQRTAREVADLLGSLRLQTFDWSQQTPPELARAIGSQPSLRRLDLTWHHGLDLEPMAGLPKLERVTLAARWRAVGEHGQRPRRIVPAPSVLADTLRPLAGCRSLRVVTVFAGSLEQPARDAMRAALPERIELRLR
ncbi:MAG: hypothetical protein ACE37K_22485 [Planctomycetota bacterium]